MSPDQLSRRCNNPLASNTSIWPLVAALASL